VKTWGPILAFLGKLRKLYVQCSGMYVQMFRLERAQKWQKSTGRRKSGEGSKVFSLLMSRNRNRKGARSIVPALRKVREERGTRSVGDTSEIKSLGHPPLQAA
jgi:hypothetical protein